VGPLCRAKFHANRCTGISTRPQKWKISTFGKDSPLWPIFTNVRGFYTANYPAEVFWIWRHSLHRLWSYCRETARQSLTPNFSLHPVGKTMRWIEKWLHLHRAKFGRNRKTSAGCRWENMVFVCKLPVLNLLTGRKSAFAPCRGDLLHRFPWNLALPREKGSAWPCKISRQVHRKPFDRFLQKVSTNID